MTCFSDYKNRPQTRPLNFDGVAVKTLVGTCKAYRESLAVALTTPEHEAIEFYLLNAAFAELSLKVDHSQTLTADEQVVLDRYYQVLQDTGHRVFFYMFLICTREARHWHKGNQKELEAKYGQSLEFFKKIPDSSSQIMEHLEASPPNFSLIDFTALLVDVFETGSFTHGYGGKAWANVAKPLRDFVAGLTTMEMFLDTAWTLAHNNGTIFNKSMLFKDAHKTELLKILDVQRAGLVPSLVCHGDSHFVTQGHVETLVKIRKVLLEFGAPQIDWVKVKALGAKGNYSHVKSPGVKSAVKTPAVDPSKLLKITPTESVLKISRKEAK